MACRAPLVRLAAQSSKGVIARVAPAASRFYSQAAAVPTSTIGTDISRDDIKVSPVAVIPTETKV
jgi:acetylornithine aminotransferase